jgi:hypothetical protein
MGIDDAYKVILSADIDSYSNYLQVRTSFDGLECVLEFTDTTGVTGLQTLVDVWTYMHDNRSNWIDDTNPV